MASFTMELKNVIKACNGDIGLKDYPIFNESHREVLNKKIIDHYYNMEIGIASVDDWLFVLNRTMREIMPEYNQKYKSELLTFNPLITTDMKMITDTLNNSDRETVTDGTSVTDSTGENNSTGSSVTDSTSSGDSTGTSLTESSSEQLANSQTGTDTNSKSRVVGGVTPQKRLAGNMDYASNVNDSTSDTSTDVDSVTSDTASSTVDNATTGHESGVSNVDQNTTGKETSMANVDGKTNVVSSDSNSDSGHGETSTHGYSGSPSALLMEFRATILNIDLEVIDALSDLFMMIWSNGDQYTNNYYSGGFRNGYYPII